MGKTSVFRKAIADVSDWAHFTQRFEKKLNMEEPLPVYQKLRRNKIIGIPSDQVSDNGYLSPSTYYEILVQSHPCFIFHFEFTPCDHEDLEDLLKALRLYWEEVIQATRNKGIGGL